jgi:hypothetical protein
VTSASSTDRLGAGRHYNTGPVGDEVKITVHQLTTADGATVAGVLFQPEGAQMVMTITHPRADSTHHVMTPLLCQAGFAVWTQGTRMAGNDLDLVHETALVDLAAGFGFLRERGFEHIVPLGHSGGGALNAFYIQQASRPPDQRITHTPAGRKCGLVATDLPMPDAVVFLAPHPGQGELLLSCIDPSVTDESDPLSVDPDLDPYSPANGFREPSRSSKYTKDFIDLYREAQRRRVARIDEKARAWADGAREARLRYDENHSTSDRRASLAPHLVIAYRTDADLRCVDLTIDPSDRPYGSLFGRRPDVINYGLLGFARITTPDAWLSTWSGLSTNASFRRCGPEVRIPTLLIELTGDQGAFPIVTAEIFAGLGSEDKTLVKVRGLHFGGPLTPDETPGAEQAALMISRWIGERFG